MNKLIRDCFTENDGVSWCLARIGSGTITVSFAAAAVSGASTAEQTIDVQFTCADGTANATKSTSEVSFVVEYIGEALGAVVLSL